MQTIITSAKQQKKEHTEVKHTCGGDKDKFHYTARNQHPRGCNSLRHSLVHSHVNRGMRASRCGLETGICLPSDTSCLLGRPFPLGQDKIASLTWRSKRIFSMSQVCGFGWLRNTGIIFSTLFNLLECSFSCHSAFCHWIHEYL